MEVGIASENRFGGLEKRVILRPQEIVSLLNEKDRFIVESGIGNGIGISDYDYLSIGAHIGKKEEVYGCDLVVRLKEPTKEEIDMMKRGSILMSMLHLPGNQKLREIIENSDIIAIPLESIKNDFGDRIVEALKETGLWGMRYGFDLLKRYKGLGPEQARVKVMGYGSVAYGAIREAARKLSQVEILNKKQIYNLKDYLPETDILVNGLNWPHELRGKVILLKRDMLSLMDPGSVICDLISNPEGQSPIETMHPTYLNNLDYTVDGVIHTSCWGWPGMDPVGISERYSKQVAPLIKDILDNGIDGCNSSIRNAVWNG